MSATDHDVLIVRQWRQAASALDEVRRRELRGLTDERALAAAEAMLELVAWAPARERQDSGLVEQQSLFQRAV